MDVLIAFHANGDCLGGHEHAFTSWAAGFVSGLAAQLRERFPQESAEQIAYRIMASADRPRPPSGTTSRAGARSGRTRP